MVVCSGCARPSNGLVIVVDADEASSRQRLKGYVYFAHATTDIIRILDRYPISGPVLDDLDELLRRLVGYRAL
jgi:hypothetical protein